MGLVGVIPVPLTANKHSQDALPVNLRRKRIRALLDIFPHESSSMDVSQELIQYVEQGADPYVPKLHMEAILATVMGCQRRWARANAASVGVSYSQFQRREFHSDTVIESGSSFSYLILLVPIYSLIPDHPSHHFSSDSPMCTLRKLPYLS